MTGGQTTAKSAKRSGVLPAGVVVGGEAREFLKRSLSALDRGMLVASLTWCEEARRELVSVLGGPDGGQGDTAGQG